MTEDKRENNGLEKTLADENLKFTAVLENVLEKLGIKGESKKRVKLLLLILLLGVVLMSMGSCQTISGGGREDQTPAVQKFSTADEEAKLEQKLEEVLSGIKGVGKVRVSVTLASGSRTEYAVNASTTVNESEESDADGSTRNTSQTVSSDTVVFEDNDNSPVVVQETRAKVQGVLIVAEGGGNTEVDSQITAAVSALLDIPVHKITVCAAE